MRISSQELLLISVKKFDNYVFYPAALKGSGVLSSPELGAARWSSPLSTLTSIIFNVFKVDDYGGSAILDMCEIDHLTSHPVLAFLDSLPEASFGLQVLSSPLSVYLSVCVWVCVCINHLLVCTITHQPLKLESPNLKHRCKTPWLRCLLFWGVIDLELQGPI